MFTSESSGGPGVPTTTPSLMKPTEFAPAPFASGEPMVSDVDDWTGGLHDGNASGGPCVRFGASARVVRRHQRCAQRACTHGTRVSSAGSSCHHHHPKRTEGQGHRQHHPLPDGHITPPSPSGELSRASLLPDFTCVAHRRTWGEPMGNPSTDKVAWPLTSRPFNDPSRLPFRCVEIPASGAYGSVRHHVARLRIPARVGALGAGHLTVPVRITARPSGTRARSEPGVYIRPWTQFRVKIWHTKPLQWAMFGWLRPWEGRRERLFWGA